MRMAALSKSARQSICAASEKGVAFAQYPLLFKLHLLFMETNACMALFITAFYWGLVRARASRAHPDRQPLRPGWQPLHAGGKARRTVGTRCGARPRLCWCLLALSMQDCSRWFKHNKCEVRSLASDLHRIVGGPRSTPLPRSSVSILQTPWCRPSVPDTQLPCDAGQASLHITPQDWPAHANLAMRCMPHGGLHVHDTADHTTGSGLPRLGLPPCWKHAALVNATGWAAAGLRRPAWQVHGCHNLFILLDLALSRIPLVSYHYQVRRFGALRSLSAVHTMVYPNSAHLAGRVVTCGGVLTGSCSHPLLCMLCVNVCGQARHSL